MRFKFLLLLAMSLVMAKAQTIDNTKAKEIAKSFLGKNVTEVNGFSTRSYKDSPDTPLKLFNAVDGKGFVVIAPYDATNPILAYSENTTIDLASAPVPVKWLLSQYETYFEKVGEADASLNKTGRQYNSKLTRASISPLLSTQWNQDAPYNNQCPVINGQHALTGCVATAMAQVINYENKTNKIKPINEYWLPEKVMAVESLPEKEFNFGNLNEEDIAWLMRYCGQAVEMQYDISESGAQSERIPAALREYFGWEAETNRLLRQDYNDRHWDSMVEEEISKGHPLIYSAFREDGSGHTFVVDGVSDDFYHVNWGWGGIADGYYSFSIFSSTDKSEYILMQEMVALRDDDPSADVIDYGTTINGINYQLQDNLTAVVLPLKDGEKYKGDLIIPSSVEYEGKTYIVSYFGSNAFVDCRHLTSIFIPATIIGQEWNIFSGCVNLHKVDVEDIAAFMKLDVGGWWTGSPFHNGADLYLKGQLVKDLVIPEGVTEITYCKFDHCTSIESVTFPSTMKVIGQYGLSECPNLKKLDMMGSSIETIGLLAFVNDESLEEVRLPATLKNIEGWAFGQVNGPGCKNLRKVICMAPQPPFRGGNEEAFSMRNFSEADFYVPDEYIQNYIGATEWGRFVELLPLSREKPLPKTAEVLDGIWIYEINLDENYAKLVDKIQDEFDGYYNIPETIRYNGKDYPVEVIGYEAFYGLNLFDFSLPSTIRKVGIRSFMWASVHNEFILPDALTKIPEKAFWDFTAPKLTIGENVESIGPDAFSSEDFIYPNLNELPLPEIEIKSKTPPVICDNTFDNHQKTGTKLKVPYGSKKAYSSAPVWSEFKSIENIGEIQEETLPLDLSVMASIEGKSYLRDGMPLKVKGKVTNRGASPVEKFNLKWSIDNSFEGENSHEVTLGNSESYDFKLEIPLKIGAAGNHELQISVSPAENLSDDDPQDNTITLNFETFDNGYYRVSLLEEFTSEQCGLTPSAREKIFEAIEKTTNIDFIAYVFNHSGFEDDFLTMTRDYEWFYNNIGTYTPAIMLNRTDLEENGFTPVMGANEYIENHFNHESGICDAMVSVFMDLNDDKAYIKTVLNKTGNFNLDEGYDYVTVFLIEDNIPAQQQMDVWSDDGYIQDYTHRYTLRKVISSTWGEIIQWDGDECLLQFETKLDSEWNKDNLSAVAFIHRYNPQSPVDCQVYTAGASSLPQYIECPDDGANWIKWDADGPGDIVIDHNELDIFLEEEGTLSVEVKPENAIGRNVTWTTSNLHIARILAVSDDTFTITFKGLEEGEALITATTSNGLSATCNIHVKTPVIEAEEIHLDVDNLELKIGDEFLIRATVLPEETTDKTVTWSSSNEDVATVSQDGFVKSISLGETIITATCGELSATCKVIVKPVLADYMQLNIEIIDIKIGETVQLEATVYPEETTDKTVTWSSSNEDVATVSEEGLVRAISIGEAYIRATCGEVSTICVVTVSPVPADTIILNIENAELRIGETVQLEATVLPEETTDKTVTWRSLTEEVASVSQEGFVRANSVGEAIIKATCGEVSATCIVTVPHVPAEAIILNIVNAELSIGETVQLEATVLPEEATDKTVTWRSLAKEVASVSEDGLVRALSIGEAIIRATCGDFVWEECVITVFEDAGVEGLLADPDSKISVYSTDGILIRKDCKVEDLKSFVKGIYIIVSGKDRYKISI